MRFFFTFTIRGRPNAYIAKAKENYSNYKIKIDEKELNDYLSNLEISKLKDINFIPYLSKEYSFTSFVKVLETMIMTNAPSNDKVIMNVLFSRYKEASQVRPLKVKIQDSAIYSLFQSLADKDDFYYDVIAMHIAKLNTFDPSYMPPFETILQSSNQTLIQMISSRLENYIDYDDILLGLKLFKNKLLYTEIAKHLTINDNGTSRADINSLIQNFEEICEYGKIEPITLLKRLNDLDTSLSDEITKTNVKEIISLSFLEQASNQDLAICSNSIKKLKDYLNTLPVDKWSVAFKNLKSYEIEASLIINYTFSTNAFEALKDVLKDIALGSISIPDRNIVEKIIKNLVEQGKNLKATFNTVRDSICNTNDITIPLFNFFSVWLFEYADLQNNQASLRTIFTSDIIRDNACLQIILKYRDKMPAIISSAGQESQDFKDIIKDKLDNDTTEDFVSFAKSIGVENLNNDSVESDSEIEL